MRHAKLHKDYTWLFILNLLSKTVKLKSMGWTGICGVQPRHQVRGWASIKIKTVNHFFYILMVQKHPLEFDYH